jgi:repressor of nif and glnA expression
VPADGAEKNDMSDKVRKKKLAILRVLANAEKPVSSALITEQLEATGHEVSERTVRLYLKELDRDGLTASCGRRGRRITEAGVEELSAARAYEKVGLLAAKIDKMTYSMSFDLAKRSGTVVINTSIIDRVELERALPMVSRVFAAGYAMGKLLTLFGPGERIGGETVPEGKVGVGTVCSITLNGVLLSHGIPVVSRFGGLLELRGGEPTRFVEIIHYDGTTLDPLEVFIRAGMTDYLGATRTGNGKIGAGLREVPAESRSRVVELGDRLDEAGLGGFMKIGLAGQQLLESPVNEERVAIIVIGGLNPMAILEESGIEVRLRALNALAEYETLFDYTEAEDRLHRLGR